MTQRTAPALRALLGVLLLGAVVAGGAPRPAAAQGAVPAAPSATSLPAHAAKVPWAIGERFTYDVKFGIIKAGSAEMTIAGVETIRGRAAWHARFRVRGGYLALKVDDLLESWMDVGTLSSLRFAQDFSEIGRDREKLFDIFPEKQTYLQHGKEERASVADPLDDGSFLYFVRTVPLELGKTYEFNQYFIPDRNPVKVRVLRKEIVDVPGGRFNCVVVQPIIKTKGIFSENGQAEIWLSDDSLRIMVQMKSKLPFGSLNLYLRTASTTGPAAIAPGAK